MARLIEIGDCVELQPRFRALGYGRFATVVDITGETLAFQLLWPDGGRRKVHENSILRVHNGQIE